MNFNNGFVYVRQHIYYNNDNIIIIIDTMMIMM